MKIYLISLGYTPILQDLNGSKTIQKEIIVNCVNPKLDNKMKALWDKNIPYSVSIVADQFSDPPLNPKVCKKFAKF